MNQIAEGVVVVGVGDVAVGIRERTDAAVAVIVVVDLLSGAVGADGEASRLAEQLQPVNLSVI